MCGSVRREEEREGGEVGGDSFSFLLDSCSVMQCKSTSNEKNVKNSVAPPKKM